MPASDILSERDAAHLLRRAGFGASASDLVAFTGLSRAEAVDALLAVKPSAARGPGKNTFDQKSLERLQVWWLRRMLSPRYRLQEKMTLFWHDHFPSGVAVIDRQDALAEQNAMFRSYGLGGFRELLHRVTRDRAMLQYLDGVRSRRGEVNENYARELMELFTLGPLDEDGQPNYEQPDVVALARALTGFTWAFGTARPQVYLAPNRFDDLEKILFAGKPFQMLGVLGVENPDGTQFPPETNVIDGLFAHRDTRGRPTLARFLVRKLWAWFATPDAGGALVDELSASFVANGYMIGELLRALLTHDAFYSEAARSSTPKTPVEFATQALRGLGARSTLKELPALLSRMGMELFNPPGVEGWQHGAAWLATSRYLARMELAQAIASARPKSGFRFKRKLPEGATADTLVDAALVELGLEVSLETRQSLIDHLAGGEFGSEAWFEMKYRGLFMLLLSLPEFQVH
ncbi:MAG: DUF1800 domain-containing protein [Myxococcota bacterium]